MNKGFKNVLKKSLHCNLNDKFSPNNRVIILHGNNIKCFQSNGPHTPCWCSSSSPCKKWRVSDIKEVREDNLNEFVQVQVLVRDGCTFRVYYSTCIIRHCPQLVKFVWKFRYPKKAKFFWTIWNYFHSSQQFSFGT